jgi:hypothetical protein
MRKVSSSASAPFSRTHPVSFSIQFFEYCDVPFVFHFASNDRGQTAAPIGLLLRSSFPTSAATFGMRQGVSDVKPSIRIVDLSDQAKRCAFDIETGPLAYGLRARKVVRTSARSLALFVQRCFEIGRLAARLSFLRLMTYMPRLEFAFREDYTL